MDFTFNLKEIENIKMVLIAVIDFIVTIQVNNNFSKFSNTC